jgi:hypothetical protein
VLSPGIPALTSPYYGNSYQPLFSNGQIAYTYFCSAEGGPVTVKVSSPSADGYTQLSILASVDRDGESVDLFTVVYDGVPVSIEHTSEVDLEPGECTTVRIGSGQYHDNVNPGYPFSFTIIW